MAKSKRKAPGTNGHGRAAAAEGETILLDSHREPVSEHALAGLRMHVDEQMKRLEHMINQIGARTVPAPAVEASGYGTAQIRGVTDIVEHIRRRRAGQAVPAAFHGDPPRSPLDALERAKSGELPLWTGPTFSTGPADHALSEIVKIGRRLEVIEDFLEHLVRRSG
jgi:hypothetical protein